MRVLVVGGAGYLGSIIVDLLKEKNVEVFVYDRFLFDNEDCCEKSLTLKETVEQKWDIIIWVASQEHEEYCKIFGQEEIDLILKLTKNKDNYFLFCSSHKMLYDFRFQNHITNHFKKIRDILRQHGKGSEYLVPELYGPSKRMRWDTVPNSLIYSAFTENQIIIGNDVLSEIKIMPVLKFAQFVRDWCVSYLLNKRNLFNYDIYAEKYSLLELAFIVKNIFEELNVNIEIEVLKFSQKTLKYLFVECTVFKETVLSDDSIDLKTTIENMKHQLEKGMFEDFQNDKYNNETFLSSLIRGIKFLRRNDS